MLDLDIFADICVRSAEVNETDDLGISSTMNLLKQRSFVAEEVLKAHPSFASIVWEIRANDEALRSDAGTPNLKQEFDDLVGLLQTDEYQDDINVKVLSAAVGAYLDRNRAGSEESAMYCDMLNNTPQEVVGLRQLILVSSALWFSDYHGFQQRAGDLAAARQPIVAAKKTEKLVRERLLDDSVSDEELQSDVGVWAKAFMFLEDAGEADSSMRRVFIAGCFRFPEVVYKKGGVVPAEFLCREIDRMLGDDSDLRPILMNLHGDQQLSKYNLVEWTLGNTDDGPGVAFTECSWAIVDKHVKEVLGIKDEERAQPAGQQPASRGVQTAAPAQEAKSSDGCYVATAVYGSYDCPEVWVLRRYRDHSLRRSPWGRAFVRMYYATSPTLVRWFGQTGWFTGLVRPRLDVLVARLRAEGYADTRYEDC